MDEMILITCVSGVAALLFIALAVFLNRKRLQAAPPAEEQPEAGGDEYSDRIVGQYGVPQEYLPEITPPVFFYDHFMIVGGRRLDYRDVVDVTFNNAAIPYLQPTYQVVIQTTLPDQEFVYIENLGDSIQTAEQVAMTIDRYVSKNC